MDLDAQTRQRIASLIEGNDVVLFMKGNRTAPQCGFSAKVVQILDEALPSYTTVDVLADPAMRSGIKEFSSWPTIPQLYVRGEFLGGCDIVQELCVSGELYAKLGVEAPQPVVPALRVSDAAASALQRLVQARPGMQLHLRVDPRFQNAMYFGPREPGEIEVEANGVVIQVDAATGRRADGVSIDAEETPEGPAFRIDNPNAPPAGS
jgi:monothiol glutaredoxin